MEDNLQSNTAEIFLIIDVLIILSFIRIHTSKSDWSTFKSNKSTTSSYFQDEIESAIRLIVEMIKKPMLAVRASIMHVKAELAAIIDKMKKGMTVVKTTVMGLGRLQIE